MPAVPAARLLPSVDELLKQAQLTEAEAQLGHEIVLKAARRAMAEARTASLAAEGDASLDAQPDIRALAQTAAELAWRVVTSTLRPVINATGVVIHTNLGRAPLGEAAIEAMAQVARGYSSLEFDLPAGRRGDRHEHIQRTLQELLGVEAAVVVNNNASAVLLALTALATGKQIVVSRGQAVEIGGGFRIPDVMRRSGAKLVEVGTTNRTYLRDYEDAITDRTAALMRVHSSNFRVIGFTSEVELTELAGLAHSRGLRLIDDLGSGSLVDTSQFGLMREPMVQHSVAAAADVVCFSGDKLLGGPQAGVIVGARDAIDRLKRDPLMRAMRTDKVSLAALEATVLEYPKGRALETLPVWQMIAAAPEDLRRRAQAWADQLPGCELQVGRSAIGGGSLPEETLPTVLLRLPRHHAPARTLALLRKHDPPVVGRIHEDAVVLDPRTVQPAEEPALLSAVRAAI
ncbi:MAG: L-seryl-tRNA(Sec) selenium transferase [Chloroflexi bacterium]|nr:L-seryl-tRNA(Sec) selenium transferase [Chloroflexota bacterium]